jgi:hypothetical protein
VSYEHHLNIKIKGIFLTALGGPDVFPVRCELDFYIPEGGILHSHRRENLKYYISLTGCAL